MQGLSPILKNIKISIYIYIYIYIFIYYIYILYIYTFLPCFDDIQCILGDEVDALA